MCSRVNKLDLYAPTAQLGNTSSVNQRIQSLASGLAQVIFPYYAASNRIIIDDEFAEQHTGCTLNQNLPSPENRIYMRFELITENGKQTWSVPFFVKHDI